MANFFNKKWSELSQEDSKAMKAKFGSKQGWQDAKAKHEGFADEAERRGNAGSGPDKGTNYQAVKAVKKELKNNAPEGSSNPSVSQMKNLRSSGTVTNDRAQNFLNNQIAKAKENKQENKQNRNNYTKEDEDFLDVDELGYNPNPNNYGNKLNTKVNKLSGVLSKLNRDDLSDSRREKLLGKQTKLEGERDSLKDKMDAMSGFDGKDLSTYDPSGVGKAKFDQKDVAFLKSQGFDEEAITSYANSLDRSKVAGNAQVLDGYDIHRDGLFDGDNNFDATVIGGKEGNNRFSGKDLRAMRQAGLSDEEIGEQLFNQQDTSTRNKKAQKLLDSYVSGLTDDGTPEPTPAPTPEPTPAPTPAPTPEPTPPGDVGGPGDDTIIDGGPGDDEIVSGGPGDDTIIDGGPGDDRIGDGNDDIKAGDDSNVIGDDGIINEDFNNTDFKNSFNGPTVGDIDVDGNNNNLDFSNNSRYFGGDNRVFNLNYGDGGNNSADGQVYTPASDLTMAGAYDVNDTPASTAAFNDMFTTLNRDNQKEYDDFGTKTAASYINMMRLGQPSDWDIINKSVGKSIYNHYDNAHTQQILMGGDPYEYNPVKFKFPKPQGAATDPDDLEDAADDYEV